MNGADLLEAVGLYSRFIHLMRAPASDDPGQEIADLQEIAERLEALGVEHELIAP